MLWLAHLHVYPVLAGGALVAEGAGADHLGVAVDGDVAGRLVLAGVVLAQGVHLGSRQQIRIVRGANEEAGYESSDYDDYTHLDTRDHVFGWMYSILRMWSKVKDHCLICYKPFLHFFQIH